MAQAKWGKTNVNGIQPKYVNKILDVSEATPCYIIGTVFAEMKFKPDVLREVELSVQGHSDIGKTDVSKLSKIDQLRSTCYSDPSTDEFWLEDESGRILITGDILDKSILVTGIIVGLLGMEVESGVFHAVDIAYPEYAPQTPISQEDNDGKLLICSGLNITEDSDRAKYEILKNWITGDLGDPKAAEVSQLLVVGNIIRPSDNVKDSKSIKNKYSEQFTSLYNKESMGYADKLFENLCHTIPVTVLPGETDVVEMGLPKQPIHHSLFHSASMRNNFNRLSDPTWLTVNGLRVLATSGENINDLVKYLIPNLKVDADIDDSITLDSRLRLIEDSLLWQIIAPTAPDTLWCYPFEGDDPFTLTETPHIYIIGNQPKFETSMVDLKDKLGESITVKIISLPAFSETNQCVLLDLKSLDCNVINFS